MQRGRKPTAAHLRVVTGTHRDDRHDAPTEQPPAADVPRPAWMVKTARKVWEQYAPAVITDGRLAPDDADTFGQWCWLVGQLRDDPKSLKATERVEMRKLAELFGMAGESSRTRLGKPRSDTKKADPAEEYFAG